MSCQGSLWKGSLLLLLLLSTLLLCKSVTSKPACPNGSDSCQKILWRFTIDALFQSVDIRSLTIDVMKALNKRNANSPWNFEKVFRPCHTASINAPETEEKAKQMSTLELFSAMRLILRSWMDPLIYLSWRSQSLPSIGENVRQLQLQSKQLLLDMEHILQWVDPSLIQDDYYIPWPELSTLTSSNTKTLLTGAYNLARCMIKDTEKILHCVFVLKCRYSDDDDCYAHSSVAYS